MGRVTAPFGVRGWIKIYALSAPITNLCEYPVWWLERDGGWRATAVVTARAHGAALIAQLAGIGDREAAAALKGAAIAVPRSELPPAAADEFYWADLVGLRVVNSREHDFGRVASILQTGANDVLAVRDDGQGGRETLIPFIAGVIAAVDLTAGVISVDWGEDY